MRKEKPLLRLLHQLVELVSDEAARNPEFAARIEALLQPIPIRSDATPKKRAPKQLIDLPDIYSERTTRGEKEFRLWLREQPTTVLHALVNHHDLDPTHRSKKWKESEKLSGFIADQLESRLERGSSFLRETNSR